MQFSTTQKAWVQCSCNSLLFKSLSSLLMQFSTTWEPVKFNAQAIITSLTGATTILIQLSPAGLIPGLMLMQLSPTTPDHDQFSCNFQLVPTKLCNAHLMQHYNYHQIRWILTENWMRIEWELTFHFCLGQLIWTIWTPMSSVPKKVDKLNLSL